MSMHKPEKIDSAQFERDIIGEKRPTAVCFFSDWSAPCKGIMGTLERLSDKYYGSMDVVLVDPEESSLIAAQYSVVSVPTVVVFIDGKPRDKIVGDRSYEDIEKMIVKYL